MAFMTVKQIHQFLPNRFISQSGENDLVGLFYKFPALSLLKLLLPVDIFNMLISNERCIMNSMKLVIPLHTLYWSIHTKDESKRGTAFAFIFGVN